MSTSSSFALTMITGTLEVCRIWRHTSVPGMPGQHQVEQHDVGAVAVELHQRGVAVGGDGDLEAFLAQHVGERLAVALFVLDDEYAGHRSSSWLSLAER